MSSQINLEKEQIYTIEVTLSGESIAILMDVLHNMPYKHSAECIHYITNQLYQIKPNNDVNTN